MSDLIYLLNDIVYINLNRQDFKKKERIPRKQAQCDGLGPCVPDVPI